MFDDPKKIARYATPEKLWAEMRNGHSPWLSSAKLKLVDGCNLRCFMCDYWRREREQELTTNEVYALFEQLREMGCEKVHLTGGELFLRKDAESLIEYASDLGMRVNLTTNGTALPKERLKSMLGSKPHSITTSVDAPFASLHDELRGRKGAFKKTIRFLEHLFRYRKKRKPRIRVNTVVSRRNIATLLEFIPIWRDLPLDGWLLIPMDQNGETSSGLTEEELSFYNRRIAPILEQEIHIPGFEPYIFGRESQDSESIASGNYARGYYQQHQCFVPWFHTLIGPQGDVYPCCGGHRIFAPLGNIRNESLNVIFSSKRYQAFRQEMAIERRQECHRCDDFLKENHAISNVMKTDLTPSRHRLAVIK